MSFLAGFCLFTLNAISLLVRGDLRGSQMQDMQVVDCQPSYVGIQSLYKAIADGLHSAVGLRREDIFINLVEVKKENWSFGNGEAQYAL